MRVVLLGWSDGVERHSFQLEVLLFQPRHALKVVSYHNERYNWRRPSVAAVAWNWQSSTYRSGALGFVLSSNA